MSSLKLRIGLSILIIGPLVRNPICTYILFHDCMHVHTYIRRYMQTQDSGQLYLGLIMNTFMFSEQLNISVVLDV